MTFTARSNTFSFSCVRSPRRCAFIFSLFAVLLLSAAQVQALDQTKLPTGDDHEKAHQAPHASMGDGIKIGILEAGGGIDLTKTDIDDEGRLISNLNFTGTFPGFVGPLAPAGPSDHATLVGEVAASNDPVYTGVANKANLYVAATGDEPSIKYAIDSYFTVNGVTLFNMSQFTGGLFDVQNHTNTQVTLNAAGSTTNIAASPFSFAGQTKPTTLHEMTITFNLNDGDTKAADFDFNNLILRLDNIDFPLVKLNDFGDGLIARRSFTTTLTGAQSTALLGALGDNQLVAQIKRVADLNDTDTGDNSGNILKPQDFNFGSGNTFANLTLKGFNTNGSQPMPLFMDWHMHKFDTLIVKSAGNEGEASGQITMPGDFYNGITVGAADGNKRASFSSWLMEGDDGNNIDGRAKPEILAPGVGVDSAYGIGGAPLDGTSFAAPAVTGVAALLEKGTEKTAGLPLGVTRNHLGIKAIILNSARKRFINRPDDGEAESYDNINTAGGGSDANYLTATGSLTNGSTITAPTSDAWSPSFWISDGTHLTVTRPLDDEQGTGLLDAERALIQLDGGEQFRDIGPNPTGIDYIGWAFGSGNGTIDTYSFNRSIPHGSFITLTLVWDRLVTELDGNNIVDANDTYSENAVQPDFDLFIYFQGELLASSTSSQGDNLEHLHYPVPYDGNPFDYQIRIESSFQAALAGSPPDYALAWWTVPEPSTFILAALAGVALIVAGRRRAACGLATAA
jgi:hypothetical protein